MRAFISINIDTDIREKILEVQTEVKNKISEINREFLDEIKWESTEKFHITLFFLGDVNESTLNKLDSSLTEVQNNFSAEEITVSSKGINAFPKLKFPRVIILELENEDKRIFKLSGMINDAVKQLGFASDKAFHPHITLGRVKRDRKINLNQLENKIKPELNFSVNSFYLMESELKSKGSEYSVIKQFGF